MSHSTPPDDPTRLGEDNQRMIPAKALLIGRVVAGVFGLIWLGMLSGMVLPLIGDTWQGYRKGFCYVRGVGEVVEYEPRKVETDEFGDETSSGGTVTYRYQVGARGYEDTERQPDSSDLRHFEGDQADVVRRLTGTLEEGQRIPVWYDPKTPSRSTLLPMSQPFMLAFVIFTMPFVLVGVGMLAVAVVGVPRRFRRKEFWQKERSKSLVSITGRGFGAFAGLAAVSAFIVAGASIVIPWRLMWTIGLVWAFAGLPATAVLVGIIMSRRDRRKGDHKPETPPSREDYDRPEDLEAAGYARTPLADDDQEQTPVTDDLPHSDFERTVGLAPEDPPLRKLEKGLVGAGVFWCGLTSVFVIVVIGSLAMQVYAQIRFEPVRARILASKIETHSDSDGTSYQPRIRYAYNVDGRRHVSERIAYDMGGGGSGDRSDAQETLNNFPVGSVRTAYYNPGDPAQSVLTTDVSTLSIFLVLFLQPFMVIGAGFIWAGLVVRAENKLRRELFARPLSRLERIIGWGRVEHAYEGTEIHSRRSATQLATTFAIGYGATCFFATFAVAIWGFLVGFENISIASIGLVLAGAVAVGLLAVMWRRGPGQRPEKIVLDARERTVRTETLGVPREVDVGRIRAVTIERETHERKWRSRGQRSTQCCLSLLLVLDNGERIKLHEFGEMHRQKDVVRRIGRAIAHEADLAFDPTIKD